MILCNVLTLTYGSLKPFGSMGIRLQASFIFEKDVHNSTRVNGRWEMHLDSELASEEVSRDVQQDPPPPLRVVAPAEARDGLLALLVDVHLASWDGNSN